jgi:hypothetical protein
VESVAPSKAPPDGHARQCQARSKRSGKRCRKWAVRGSGFCAFHGGRSLAGIAHPNFKHGKRSKYMMPALDEKVREAASDPELLSLREDIALVDGLLAESLQRLDSGESAAVWKEVLRVADDMAAAVAMQDMERVFGHATAIKTLVDRASKIRAAVQDTVNLIEQRRRLIESEAKRLEKMHQMARYEDVALFVRRVFISVRQHVSDQDALDAIANDLHPLIKEEASR